MTSNNNRRIWRAGVAVAFAMLTVSLSAQSSAHPVEAAVKPGQPWRAYTPLLDSTKRINLRAYALLNYFDGKSTSQTGLRPAEEKNH